MEIMSLSWQWFAGKIGLGEQVTYVVRAAT
jgi:hypothetical protein